MVPAVSMPTPRRIVTRHPQRVLPPRPGLVPHLFELRYAGDFIERVLRGDGHDPPIYLVAIRPLMTRTPLIQPSSDRVARAHRRVGLRVCQR